MKIIDTHAHYDDEAFDEDREALLGGGLKAGGVELVVNVGATLEGAEKSVALARRYPAVYAAVGVHPDEVGIFEHPAAYLERKRREREEAQAEARAEATSRMDTQPEETAAAGVHTEVTAAEEASAITPWELRTDIRSAEDALGMLRELAAEERCVAIGEIGLDYHWMVETKDVQQRWFIRQLELSRETGLPINVHSREASQDTFDLICRYHAGAGCPGGIIHCFSGSAELAAEYVKRGYCIGVGGVVTYKNSRVLKEVVRRVPLSALVTETDSPYLAPVPHRGERNDSRNIRHVIAAIAQLREMDEEACAAALEANARRVYRLEG